MSGLAGLALLAAAASPVLAQEKTVRVYNWSDYIDESILEDFTKETGIKVQYDVFDSNEILETKLLAGKTGYDIVVPTGSFLSRQIKAGVFQKLDKAKLSNLGNMWPEIMERLAKYDPGNEHAVNYMWGTTGIGYNVKKIKERMADAPLDSWALVLDPEIVKKFKDCGVMMLDAPDEIVPATMNYLGINPDSKDPADFKKAADHFKKIRPYVRKFHSSEYINALANGDVCLVVGWSGDVIQAKTRAEEKNASITDEAKKTEISYTIPKEGALMWFDNLAIPADAPNADGAHQFINYLMRPEVIAKATNYVAYANGNLASQKFVDKAILEDTRIYPGAETIKRLYTTTPNDQKTQRALTSIWRKMKRK
ncbi:MAG: polyamine ABC transporter substrate-binding protein [Hyphomicrobiaceae bacterium]